MPQTIELRDNERVHVARHLIGFAYLHKSQAEMTRSILSTLGYRAELSNEGAEWSVVCTELEPVE